MNPFSTSYKYDAPDSILVREILDGNKVSMNGLILRHQPFIYNIAWKMLADPMKAHESDRINWPKGNSKNQGNLKKLAQLDFRRSRVLSPTRNAQHTKFKVSGVKILYSNNYLKVHAMIALVKRDHPTNRYLGLLATRN